MECAGEWKFAKGDFHEEKNDSGPITRIGYSDQWQCSTRFDGYALYDGRSLVIGVIGETPQVRRRGMWVLKKLRFSD